MPHVYLKTEYLGKAAFFFYPILDSTQELVKFLAKKGAPEGVVIWAGAQSAGKGRGEKVWFSPKEGIYLSLILRPKVSLEKLSLITLLTGVAVAEGIEEVCGLKIGLKWPNDLWTEGKKLGGILTEFVLPEAVIVGIGINAAEDSFPQPLSEIATSLFLLTGKKYAYELIVESMLFILEKRYEAFKKGDLQFLEDWQKRSVLQGKWILIETKTKKIKGKVEGIDKNGALLLKVNREVLSILSGDISIIEG